MLNLRVITSMNLMPTLVTGLLLASSMAAGAQTPDKIEKTGAAGDAPSFACSAAIGSVQELICDDAELGAFDRRLNGLYRQALETFSEEKIPNLRAYQRGWIQGRDDCWKATDVAACVAKEYQHRITELQISVADTNEPAATTFSCNDGVLLTAYFYNDTELPALLLKRQPDEVLLFRVISASGAKYLGRNVSFWQKGKSAQLEWNGEKTQCRIKASRADPA